MMREEAFEHAVELLNNTLEPDLLILIQPILEERADDKAPDKEMLEILRGFSRSEDRWLSLISRFLITKLKLGERWLDLKGAARSADEVSVSGTANP